MINNKLQMNHVESGFSYISFHFFPSSVGTVKILLFFPQDHRDRTPFCNWFLQRWVDEGEKNIGNFTITLQITLKERDGLAKNGSDWLLDSRR